MAKTTVSPKKPLTFWQKVHQNRLKIAFLLFVVIVPVALLLSVYIGAYANNRKVHFDPAETPESVYIKKFESPDELQAITLDISWYELKYPVANDADVLQNGSYTFDIFYEAKENYEVLQVSVTPVLQTPWMEKRSIGTLTTLSTSSRRVSVPFNFELPVKTLFFINVTDPVLYLKVDTNFMSAGSQITKTEYVVFYLNELNPTRVA